VSVGRGRSVGCCTAKTVLVVITQCIVGKRQLTGTCAVHYADMPQFPAFQHIDPRYTEEFVKKTVQWIDPAWLSPDLPVRMSPGQLVSKCRCTDKDCPRRRESERHYTTKECPAHCLLLCEKRGLCRLCRQRLAANLPGAAAVPSAVLPAASAAPEPAHGPAPEPAGDAGDAEANDTDDVGSGGDAVAAEDDAASGAAYDDATSGGDAMSDGGMSDIDIMLPSDDEEPEYNEQVDDEDQGWTSPLQGHDLADGFSWLTSLPCSKLLWRGTRDYVMVEICAAQHVTIVDDRAIHVSEAVDER
jgi:hypothetical protein